MVIYKIYIMFAKNLKKYLKIKYKLCMPIR